MVFIMPTRPPTIVYYAYRPKRARKRKQQPAIPNRIVTIPRMRAKVAAPEAEDTAAVVERPRIVTAPT